MTDLRLGDPVTVWLDIGRGSDQRRPHYGVFEGRCTLTPGHAYVRLDGRLFLVSLDRIGPAWHQLEGEAA